MGTATRNASHFVIFILFGMYNVGPLHPADHTLGIVSCSLAAAMAHLMGGTDEDGLPTHCLPVCPAILSGCAERSLRTLIQDGSFSPRM